MRLAKRTLTKGTLAGGAALVCALAGQTTLAHKAVTSPYDFNKDIFPILRDRCGSCHVEGGPAMTLMTYKAENGGASAWAEQMREMLVDEQMPPWSVDLTSPGVQGGHTISTRDLDKLVTWASGGTPEGDLDKKLPQVPYHVQWKGGPPDAKLELPAPYTLPAGADTPPETRDYVVPTTFTETRWVRLADLLPGYPIVRNAVIAIENGPVLAVWVPDNDPIPTPRGTAFKLPAGARLNVRIRYQKQWWDQNAITDRSTIGLYFTDAPAAGRDVQVFELDEPSLESADPEHPHTFGKPLTGAARVVALRPRFDHAYAALTVEAVTPTGRKVSLLKLRQPRPEWNRRYWLAEPAELPAGSKIQVNLTTLPPDFELPVKPVMKPESLQIALDYVPQ